jgi:dTDP-4-amino-4,6-dideoxygalactose transaminase
VIRVRDRDSVIRELADVNIGTGIHYPVPLHKQKAYESLTHWSGDLTVTERVSAEILSLPMFPQLTLNSQIRIVAEVIQSIEGRRAKELVASTDVR